MLSRLYINQMRNKELALRRLQTIQGRLKQLEFVINRGSSEERTNALKELNELLNDLQSIIEREN
jgi:hypothetical protein